MDVNFFYYSIYDRFIRRQPCACIHAFVNFFFKKTSPQKLLTGFLPNFTGMFLRYRLKTSLHHYRKISLWSDTGAQVPLVFNELVIFFLNSALVI